MAQALASQWIDELESLTLFDATVALREAVRVCCHEDAFATVAGQMRAAREQEADFALNLMPWLANLPANVRPELLELIMDRFVADADSSRFGLMNAVTAVARDRRDPELRWRLEEFGGGLAVVATRSPVRDGSAARSLIVA
jgi:hypothetical protein